MKIYYFLSIIIMLFGRSFGEIIIDEDFLSDYYFDGGSVLFDKAGNIHYLWVYTNRDELNLNKSGEWKKIRYEYWHKETNQKGEILVEKTLLELGPLNLHLYTNGVFDSNGNLFAIWNMCIRSDVVSPHSDESSPYYSIIVKIDSLGKDSESYKTMPFERNILAVDASDTIWAVGIPPGSMTWGLVAARLYPNTEQQYTRIYGWGAHKEQEYSHITEKGFGLYSLGLKRNILGFSINQDGRFLLCDRSSEYDTDNSSNILLSYRIDKVGKLQRDPYEINMEDAACRIIQYDSLPNTKGIRPSEIFTDGTRLVNYGKDQIFALVMHDEKIYIIHLSDDGSPIKTTAGKIVKPTKLPAEWEPSIRLWSHATEGLDRNYFFIFGIDSLLNFYWEAVPLE